MKDYKELARLKLVPLKYEDIVSELREETAYPPYVDMLMKRAAEAVEQLVKERDNARRTLDQTLVRLNDETVRADRLEAENRAKEQYIAETIGKLARERKRDDEIIASLQKELVEAAKERDAAIADIREALNRTEECLLCRWFDGTHGCRKSDKSCEKSKTDEWEWRGVQEVEHGRTKTD